MWRDTLTLLASFGSMAHLGIRLFVCPNASADVGDIVAAVILVSAAIYFAEH